MPASSVAMRHRAAQRVDFLDQVPLADAADRRVARHLAQRLDVVRQEQRAPAHARRRERGLGAGMAAADDDHVETRRKIHDFIEVFAPAACAKRRAHHTAKRLCGEVAVRPMPCPAHRSTWNIGVVSQFESWHG